MINHVLLAVTYGELRKDYNKIMASLHETNEDEEFLNLGMSSLLSSLFNLLQTNKLTPLFYEG